MSRPEWLIRPAGYNITVPFGAQIRQSGGLLAALRRAEAMGAEVMQVFPQSPRQWRYPEANAERSLAFGRAWPVSGVVRRVVCHAPYLINLGAADPEVYATSTTRRWPTAPASTATTTPAAATWARPPSGPCSATRPSRASPPSWRCRAPTTAAPTPMS